MEGAERAVWASVAPNSQKMILRQPRTSFKNLLPDLPGFSGICYSLWLARTVLVAWFRRSWNWGHTTKMRWVSSAESHPYRLAFDFDIPQCQSVRRVSSCWDLKYHWTRAEDAEIACAYEQVGGGRVSYRCTSAN